MDLIVVISASERVSLLLTRLLAPASSLRFFTRVEAALGLIYESLPRLIILDLTLGKQDFVSLIKNNLKDDPLFLQLPIIAILNRQTEVLSFRDLPVEDFLWEEDLERDLLLRVELARERAKRSLEVNPLTKLPGNTAICREIERRLAERELFALAYADLDYFKAYNDRYGFGRGDEVLKATGRIILNVVRLHQETDSFVGHIGGDDFVYIAKPFLVEKIAEEIINLFTEFITVMYDPEDREAAAIKAVDRQGVIHLFPLINISIGITDAEIRPFRHYGEMIEAASQMKSYAKKQRGSVVCRDRRGPGTSEICSP
jgi:diguanylate cyclase (GGDEF)-like protein